LLPLAFAPFNLFPFAVLAPALLFVTWLDASPRRAAFRGLLFGLGMFGLGVSWVYVSMHHFGNMPAPLAAFVTLLFVAGLSIYPALLGWSQRRFFPKRGTLHFVLILPSLWVLFEWLRGWLLTGFPWLDLGYSQVAVSLSGYASWLGVYGVSYFCAVSGGLIVWATQAPGKFFRLGLPLILIIWTVGWIAGKTEWVQPAGNPLQVTLIQGNIPIEDKWRPEKRDAIVNRYLTLSKAADKSDLIIWPESAVPVYLDEIDQQFFDSLRGISQRKPVDILFGVAERDKESRRYYNSVVSVGAQPGVYRKRHLVPFGEFPPLEPLFSWLMQNFRIPMSNFSSGARAQPPLIAAGQIIGVSICYEDAFGTEMIDALPEATLLVNVSEDAWFGDSFAPHQRIQMARMRAIESGRPMLRAANTGPSVVVDYLGQIIATTPAFQVYSLTTLVQPMQGATPYVRFGNFPVLILSLIGVAGGVAYASRRRFSG
jgi:apolipoprotein N-acyltransferase